MYICNYRRICLLSYCGVFVKSITINKIINETDKQLDRFHEYQYHRHLSETVTLQAIHQTVVM